MCEYRENERGCERKQHVCERALAHILLYVSERERWSEIVSVAGTSPVFMTQLEEGYAYTLRVTPIGEGCSIVKKLRESFTYIEPYV